MKKSILLFCLAVLLILAGCGQDSAPSSSSSMPEPASEPESSLIESSDIYSEPESSYLDEPYYEESIPEEEPASMEDGLHGLIVVSIPENRADYTVSSINPDTGEIQEISFFSRGGTYTSKSTGERYTYDTLDSREVSGSYSRRLFNADYTKMAVTKIYIDTGRMDAGWLDTNGTFFNVTEAVGQSSDSDFNTKKYLAHGFDKDGNFVWRLDGSFDGFSVPISDISSQTIEDYDCSPYKYELDSHEMITSWIDDTHCIINTVNASSSRIYNIETEEYSDYLPETDRPCWNGVVSPDGAQVAFMSSGGQHSESFIYIMPLSGGDPVRVDCGMSFSSQNNVYSGSCVLGGGGTLTFLIDWC